MAPWYITKLHMNSQHVKTLQVHIVIPPLRLTWAPPLTVYTEYICVHMLCARHADFLRLTCLPWLHHVFGCRGNGGRCRFQLGPCCQVTAELWEWRRGAWAFGVGGGGYEDFSSQRARWKYRGSSGIETHRLNKEISFPLWAERILMSGWIQKLSLLPGNGSTNKINCTHAQATPPPQALVWLTNANRKERKPLTHALVVRAWAAATVESALVFLADGGL